MSSIQNLNSAKTIIIHQKHEIAELIGFETRNKFSIETEDGIQIGFAAEQHKGVLDFLLRQFLGHWRRFEILIFDNTKNIVVKAVHPFRFFFQRLEIYPVDGSYLGAVQQRFSLLTKKFDVLDATHRVIFTVSSPLWKLWTFPFTRNGRIAATVKKKWSGILSEAFTDKDKFQIEFSDPMLTENEKTLLLASALFIDLQYFEKKAH